MATAFPDLWAALAAPFDPADIKVKPGGGGTKLHYARARVYMNRLDNVLGPENWWDEYVQSEKSVLCRLTIRLPDGTTVTKCDAGGYAGMSDQGDDEKSGVSDSFKRACVKFGPGRFLYNDGLAHFGDDAAHEHHAPPPTNGHTNGHPNGNGNGHATAREATVSGNSSTDRLPETGKALFAWMKKHEERLERPIVPKLDAWRKQNRPEWTFKTTEWDASQVSDALSFLAPLIASFDPENESQEPGTPRPRVQPTANGNGHVPASSPSGPLTIAKDDPLGPLKLAIKDACKRVVHASTGVTPTPEGVMARIDWYASEAFGEGCVVGNLRECRDRAVLNGVLKAAEDEVGTLDAMEATP